MKERIERLIDADYCGSEWHQELMWTTDCYERQSLDHAFLNDFAKGMVKYFGKVHAIPVYPAEIQSYAVGGAPAGRVRILHCHYGYELHREDWEVIANIGREFASGFYCEEDVVPRYSLSDPSWWHLDWKAS